MWVQGLGAGTPCIRYSTSWMFISSRSHIGHQVTRRKQMHAQGGCKGWVQAHHASVTPPVGCTCRRKAKLRTGDWTQAHRTHTVGARAGCRHTMQVHLTAQTNGTQVTGRRHAARTMWVQGVGAHGTDVVVVCPKKVHNAGARPGCRHRIHTLLQTRCTHNVSAGAVYRHTIRTPTHQLDVYVVAKPHGCTSG